MLKILWKSATNQKKKKIFLNNLNDTHLNILIDTPEKIKIVKQ